MLLPIHDMNTTSIILRQLNIFLCTFQESGMETVVRWVHLNVAPSAEESALTTIVDVFQTPGTMVDTVVVLPGLLAVGEEVVVVEAVKVRHVASIHDMNTTSIILRQLNVFSAVLFRNLGWKL